jgi:hypothetical protein
MPADPKQPKPKPIPGVTAKLPKCLGTKSDGTQCSYSPSYYKAGGTIARLDRCGIHIHQEDDFDRVTVCDPDDADKLWMSEGDTKKTRNTRKGQGKTITSRKRSSWPMSKAEMGCEDAMQVDLVPASQGIENASSSLEELRSTVCKLQQKQHRVDTQLKETGADAYASFDELKSVVQVLVDEQSRVVTAAGFDGEQALTPILRV